VAKKSRLPVGELAANSRYILVVHPRHPASCELKPGGGAKIGPQPQIIRVKGPSPAYEAAFSAMNHERAQALVVLEETINAACRKQTAELASVR
jgi:hypothetical protein